MLRYMLITALLKLYDFPLEQNKAFLSCFVWQICHLHSCASTNNASVQTDFRLNEKFTITIILELLVLNRYSCLTLLTLVFFFLDHFKQSWFTNFAKSNLDTGCKRET